MAEPTYSFPAIESDPSNYSTVQGVGQVYEVGINGVGLMLADMPAGQQRYERMKVSLNPERVLDGSTPFNQSIERYHMQVFADFKGGAGVQFADREGDDGTRFWRGMGVWPFNEGRIGPGPEVQAVTNMTGFDGPLLTSAGGRLYAVAYDGTSLKYVSTRTGAASTITLPDGCFDLTSDGQYFYAACGTTIERGTTSTSTWSAVDAFHVDWAGGRICASAFSGGGTARVWTTLDENGDEEVPGGRLILDDGWWIQGSTGGQGFVWFPAFTSGYKSVVYRWVVGSDNPPSIAWELPLGQIAYVAFWAQGSLFVWAYGGRPLLYRCAINSDGTLNPFLVTDFQDLPRVGGSYFPEGAIVPQRLVSWHRWVFIPVVLSNSPSNTKVQTLFALDLSTGGISHIVRGKAVFTGTVKTVPLTVWSDSTGRQWLVKANFDSGTSDMDLEAIDLSRFLGYTGDDVYGEAVVSEVDFPIVDKASNMDKVWDDVEIQFEPPGETGHSFWVLYTLDGGETYLAGSQVLPGATDTFARVVLNKKSRSLGLKISWDPGNKIIINTIQLRFHPLGLDDAIVRLPVLCTDYQTGLNGRPLRENGKGRGAQLARWLESLTQTRVKFQDRDYPITGNAGTTWEVVSVELSESSVHDRRFGRQAWQGVATVTLRKSD